MGIPFIVPGAAFDQISDQNAVDPRLGPLGDNGGPTLTHLPRLGSPALDQGSLACPPADQRGVARPQGAACDLGAVERQAADVDMFRLLLPFALR